MPVRTKTIKAGSWRTLESSWNATFTVWCRSAPGVKVRIRYGADLLGYTGDHATLDGDLKRLEISGVGSLAYARLQAKATQTTSITYALEVGNVGSLSIPF